MPQLFDGSGKPVALGPKLAQGGEGAVFKVQDNSSLVAKVYHDSHRPDGRKTAKLNAMVQSRTDRLAKLSAWPIDILHEGRGGPVRGFLMPMLTGFKEMHLLYTPKSRLTEFPEATWAFLTHTAMNMAIAFRAVHQDGHVIGDVNHGNIFVSPKATVRLIDCDSFQITGPADTYLCEVGVGTHTPPELQGKSFKTVRRSANHDLFGLAVAVFQLLFLGRHPFSGVPLGKGDPPALETAIAEFRFAYGRDAGTRMIRPPPGGLALSQVTPTIAALFERAFSPSSTGNQGRPSAEDWAIALKAQLDGLKACQANAGHVFLRANSACPWCSFEVAAGRAMFNVVYKANQHSGIDVDALAAEIAAVAAPVRRDVPEIKGSREADPQYIEAGGGNWRQVQFALAAGGFISLLGLLPQFQDYELAMIPLAIAVSLFIGTMGPARELKRKAKAELREARERIATIKREWEVEKGPEEFLSNREKLERLAAKHRLLPTKQRSQLLELDRRREEMQMRQWLDNHEIRDAKIKGVGDGRKTTLQSFNIETALHVIEADLWQVPGFGRVLIDALLTWRGSIEKRFRFNPSLQADPAEIRRIHQAIQVEQAQIERDLITGLANLKQLSLIATERYAALARRLTLQAAAERKAMANIAACR